MITKAISAFLFDFLIHWAVLVACVLIVKDKKKKTITIVTLALYFSVLVITPIPTALLSNLERTHKAAPSPESMDAVVALGGDTLFYNQEINQFQLRRSANRMFEAMRLVKSGQAKYFVMTGGTLFDVKNKMLNEAQSVQKLAEEMGIPKENIFIEQDSVNTFENAKFTKKILEELGVRDFYLVTSAYHMKRSMKTFEKAGLNPKAFPVDFLVEHSDSNWYFKYGMTNLSHWRVFVHEYVGYFYYWLRGYL